MPDGCRRGIRVQWASSREEIDGPGQRDRLAARTTSLRRGATMSGRFQLSSEYRPQGDQPEAIRQLTDGLLSGDRFETLVGVTGSGKTYTVANVIERVQRPTLVIAHNKTLA